MIGFVYTFCPPNPPSPITTNTTPFELLRRCESFPISNVSEVNQMLTDCQSFCKEVERAHFKARISEQTHSQRWTTCLPHTFKQPDRFPPSLCIPAEEKNKSEKSQPGKQSGGHPGLTQSLSRKPPKVKE